MTWRLKQRCFKTLSGGTAVLMAVQIFLTPLAEARLLTPAFPILNPSQLSIPSSVGRVVDQYQPALPSKKPLVVHIQDIHNHPAAQKNISAILSTLKNASEAPLVVGLEGAWTALDLSAYAVSPLDEVRAMVTNRFVEKDLLSGAHAFALNHPLNAVQLTGAEKKGPYLENLHVRDRSKKSRAEMVEALRFIRKRVDRLMFHLMPRSVRAFEAARVKHHNGTLPVSDYLVALQNIDTPTPDLTSIQTFSNLNAASLKVSSTEVARDRKRLIEKLATKVSKEGMASLLTWGKAFKKGQVSAAGFYRHLIQAAESNNVRVPASLWNVLYYLEKTESFSADQFIEQVDVYEVRAREALTKKARDIPSLRKLLELSHLLEGQIDLWKLELIPHRANHILETAKKTNWAEQEKFLQALERANGLKPAPSVVPVHYQKELRDAVRFYELALKRDEIMARQTKRHLSKIEAPLYVLIAGGFHTDGLKKKFKEENIPFIVVQPSLEYNRPQLQRSQTVVDPLPLSVHPKTPFAPLIKAFREASASSVQRGQLQNANAIGIGLSADDIAHGLEEIKRDGRIIQAHFRKDVMNGVEVEENKNYPTDFISEILSIADSHSRDEKGYIGSYIVRGPVYSFVTPPDQKSLMTADPWIFSLGWERDLIGHGNVQAYLSYPLLYQLRHIYKYHHDDGVRKKAGGLIGTIVQHEAKHLFKAANGEPAWEDSREVQFVLDELNNFRELGILRGGGADLLDDEMVLIDQVRNHASKTKNPFIIPEVDLTAEDVALEISALAALMKVKEEVKFNDHHEFKGHMTTHQSSRQKNESYHNNINLFVHAPVDRREQVADIFKQVFRRTFFDNRAVRVDLEESVFFQRHQMFNSSNNSLLRGYGTLKKLQELWPDNQTLADYIARVEKSGILELDLQSPPDVDDPPSYGEIEEPRILQLKKKMGLILIWLGLGSLFFSQARPLYAAEEIEAGSLPTPDVESVAQVDKKVVRFFKKVLAAVVRAQKGREPLTQIYYINNEADIASTVRLVESSLLIQSGTRLSNSYIYVPDSLISPVGNALRQTGLSSGLLERVFVRTTDKAPRSDLAVNLVHKTSAKGQVAVVLPLETALGQSDLPQNLSKTVRIVGVDYGDPKSVIEALLRIFISDAKARHLATSLNRLSEIPSVSMLPKILRATLIAA